VRGEALDEGSGGGSQVSQGSDYKRRIKEKRV